MVARQRIFFPGLTIEHVDYLADQALRQIPPFADLSFRAETYQGVMPMRKSFGETLLSVLSVVLTPGAPGGIVDKSIVFCKSIVFLGCA
jgi:hypothetical protein